MLYIYNSGKKLKILRKTFELQHYPHLIQTELKSALYCMYI